MLFTGFFNVSHQIDPLSSNFSQIHQKWLLAGG
jgi:hypothetical protein